MNKSEKLRRKRERERERNQKTGNVWENEVPKKS